MDSRKIFDDVCGRAADALRSASTAAAQPREMRRGLFAHLCTMRDVMRSAREKKIPMSVWERDLLAMAAAIVALDSAVTRPDRSTPTNGDKNA